MGFGGTEEDIDGVPKIDRGPPEEDRRTEAELRGAMQDISKARATMGELATVRGISEQIAAIQLMIDELCEQQNRIVKRLTDLSMDFDQFKAQRAIELQSWLARNGGSTSPEDN